MNNNAQRYPFVESMNRFTDNKMQTFQGLLSKSVPASVVDVDPSGTIVTVKFELVVGGNLPQIKMPVFGPEFARLPLQKGQKGVVLSADYSLGAMSGLGKGVATLAPQGGFSTGVFFPIGNVDNSPTDNPQAYVIYGPDGAIIRDSKSKIVFTLSPETGLTIVWNGQTLMKFDSNGIAIEYQGKGINITSAGTFIDGLSQPYPAHEHTGVMTGGGNTGPVNP
jgi:hypothetical protein